MPGRQVRVVGLAADRAEQDRVVLADLGEHRVGQHLAGGEVALGAEVVAGLLELHVGRGGHLEDLEGLGGHLRADAVAGDDGELDGCRRRVGHAAEASCRRGAGRRCPAGRARPAGRPGVLVAARVLRVVAGRAPVGIHVVHRSCLLVSGSDRDESVMAEDAPRRGRSDSWIARGMEPGCCGSRVMSEESASRGRLDLLALRCSRVRSHATPNHRGEVASRQASPRRSMSTNTLRMVETTVRRRTPTAAAGFPRAVRRCETAVPRMKDSRSHECTHPSCPRS